MELRKDEKRVIISGLDIPFWDLVWFMVKLSFASIPALLIIYFIVLFFSFLINLLFGLGFSQF